MQKNMLEFLRGLQENYGDLERCIDLLVRLQNERGPVIEAMTIVRYEKPTLFGWLRSRLSYRPGLLMMLDVYMDYHEAVRRIDSSDRCETTTVS